jgi:CxxC motif-containing protein (DUF1111 family)
LGLLALALLLCAGCAAREPYRGARFGDVLGPTALSRAGSIAFAADRVGEIRGPFNQVSCAKCHAVPTPGGAQTNWNDFVMKTSVDGRLQSYPRYRLVHGMLELRTQPKWYFLRRPQPLYGIGLLQAVSLDELRRIAAEEPPRHRGRIPLPAGGRVGRFGWKADVPTVSQFVATAFVAETGVPYTKDIRAVTAFLVRLAPPPRGKSSGTRTGRELFASIGCADCHRPLLRIGTFAPMPALSNRRIDAYTDLLLHDMGPAEADVPQGVARASEYITPPLWGVAQIGPPYMHDGRAMSLTQAIESHGGQAEDSAKAYFALTTQQQAAILHFLHSL